MDLAPEHGPDQQRVDEIVRMIDAEQHGTYAGDTLGMSYVHRLEEEPHPEARDGPDASIEGVWCIGDRLAGARRGWARKGPARLRLACHTV